MLSDWARLLMLVLAAVFWSWLPASGQEACTDRSKLSLIYDPDEPPPCPITMRDLVPSKIGRPQDYSAIELAACAGMMDAVAFADPEFGGEDEIDGNEYFEAAMALRERPPQEILEEWRSYGRESWVASMKEPLQIFGALAHGLGQCSRAWYNWHG